MRNKSLESRVPGNWPARFGGGPTEKARASETSLAAYPTLRGLGASNGSWLPDSFAWTARFRRLARDYERLADTLVGLHLVAFAVLMLGRLIALAVESS